MPEVFTPTEAPPAWEAQSYLPTMPEIPAMSFQEMLDTWMQKNRVRCGEE